MKRIVLRFVWIFLIVMSAGLMLNCEQFSEIFKEERYSVEVYNHWTNGDGSVKKYVSIGLPSVKGSGIEFTNEINGRRVMIWGCEIRVMPEVVTKSREEHKKEIFNGVIKKRNELLELDK